MLKKSKIPFTMKFNLDSKQFVRVRNDKFLSNIINTFNRILLDSYKKNMY